MGAVSASDQSNALLLRLQSQRNKVAVSTLSTELATGLKQDKGKAVGHDFSLLSNVQRSLKINESYRFAITEAELFMSSAQLALGRVGDALTELSSMNISAVGSGSVGLIGANSLAAQAQLGTVVDALNTSVGGRRLFGGNVTDQAPLASAQDILDALRPLAMASNTAAEWETALNTWFGAGGGFETLMYQGGAGEHSGFLVADGTRTQMTVKADHEAIREAMKGLVSVALVGDTGFSNNRAQVQNTMGQASTRALTGQTNLAMLQAEVGAAEGVIERSSVQLEAEDSLLKIAQSNIMGADPFETATYLEEASTRLETLYLLTSRLSRLSLTEYLR